MVDPAPSSDAGWDSEAGQPQADPACLRLPSVAQSWQTLRRRTPFAVPENMWLP